MSEHKLVDADELKDRCGNRVIVKIEWEDFKHWSNKNEI